MSAAPDKCSLTDSSKPLVLPFKHTTTKIMLCKKSLKLLDWLPDRIIDKIYFNAYTGCWEWQGCCGSNGYGQCRWNGFMWLTHRLTFELIRGKIDKNPDHIHLMHLCENKGCCNPWHLKPGTNSDNQLHYHKMRKQRK